MSRAVARVGDTCDHGGSIISSNQDGSVKAEGKEVAVEGAVLNCSIHGQTEIHGNLDDNWTVNGKKVVLDGSVADCGAVIIASASRTFGG